MITLIAKTRIDGANTVPFRVGETAIGTSTFGEELNINIIFDKRNMTSFNSKIIDRSDVDLPSWGVISNGGSLNFIDRNHKFYGYANAGYLNDGMPVELYIKNTISGKSEKCGVYYTKNWNYDNTNLAVSVELKDDLEEWQDIEVNGFFYDPRNPESKTMEWFYRYLQQPSVTPSKYKMLPFDSLNEITKYVLKNTVVKYPMLKRGNLWSQWNKLCQCCSLYIFKGKDGETICRYSGGS